MTETDGNNALVSDDGGQDNLSILDQNTTPAQPSTGLESVEGSIVELGRKIDGLAARINDTYTKAEIDSKFTETEKRNGEQIAGVLRKFENMLDGFSSKLSSLMSSVENTAAIATKNTTSIESLHPIVQATQGLVQTVAAQIIGVQDEVNTSQKENAEIRAKQATIEEHQNDASERMGTTVTYATHTREMVIEIQSNVAALQPLVLYVQAEQERKARQAKRVKQITTAIAKIPKWGYGLGVVITGGVGHEANTGEITEFLGELFNLILGG